MESAFVGNQAKAIWMNGVHAPTAVKPSAKTLMGSALEYAIDPLGDQSFYYSAMRSTVTIDQGGQRTARIVGVSPANARIWIGRPKDWTAFVDELEALIDHAAGAHAGTNLFNALAQRVTDFATVGMPYSVVVLPPELLSENDVSAAQREMAVAWAYDAKLVINRVSAATNMVLAVSLQGLMLGELSITITPQADRHLVEGKWTRRVVDPNPEIAAKQNDARETGLEYLIELGWISIYYDSGHTLTQCQLFRPRFRDAPFDWGVSLDFTGYDVDVEKPEHDKAHPLIRCIAALDKNGKQDTSLFAYVVEQMFKDAKGNRYGWLASDDGSMEFADFVHIDPAAQVVTLVHVKAANSNVATREVSVSAYEIVVAQAIKNLRHLDHRHLADALHKGKHKKIARAVWHNGIRQTNRKGIISAARALRPDYKRRLIVLQPQLTDNEHMACLNGTATAGRIERLKLLSTLLNGARANANNVGAGFLCSRCV
ncbi:hypothetical protein IP70_21755 [alpha proteobacterium AAP38]|nr:hypothetical protein IP70_21755 [alpha proteobacterium AAP38]